MQALWDHCYRQKEQSADRCPRRYLSTRVGNNTEVLDAETLRVQAYMNLYGSSYEAVLANLRLRPGFGSL